MLRPLKFIYWVIPLATSSHCQHGDIVFKVATFSFDLGDLLGATFRLRLGVTTRQYAADFNPATYGVVPKGLLTFLGSFYKEVAKTTSGTLVYRFERQTSRKKYFFLRKTLCPRLVLTI